MLRRLLLFLSARKGLRHWLENSSHAARLTSRFIAGQTLDDAIRVGKRLDRECTLLTLDRLGENVAVEAEARASLDGYLQAIARLAELSLPASVSIKPTQFGMDLSDRLCRELVEALVREARSRGKVVEIDMESSEYVDRTLRLVMEMHRGYGNVRGVIQAYLYRSEKDIQMLCAEGVPVRLCKGAYKEPAGVAFQAKRDVDSSYVRLMKTLLENGVYPALATHDERIIGEAKRFVREREIEPDRYEFQMLYGIRRDLERQFVAEGYRIRLYVPYGEAWYPYFMRRLAERPANLMFLLKNIARG